MYKLALFILSYLFFFVLRRNRTLFYDLSKSALNLLDTMLLEEADHVKYNLVKKANIQLLSAFFKLLLLVVGICIIFYFALIYLNELIFQKEDNLFRTTEIIVISIASILAFVFPKNKNYSNYSELAKLLHFLVLDNYNVHKKLFRNSIQKIPKKRETKFLIVSGLARSGTTSFLIQLAKTNEFASLSYNQMPFILSPNLMQKLTFGAKEKMHERSHKDGIKIGINSNEALEEYFWKAHLNDGFIKKEILEVHSSSQEIYDSYLDYQNAIINESGKIYLAKNNNFLLRYLSIREKNKDFVFVVMVRDPLTHADSLFSMHKKYCEMQMEDKFVLDYMNWLGHHEFGLNQKSFELIYNRRYKDKNHLNFWIEEWINYYTYVLENIGKINLVFYEDYCLNSKKCIDRILGTLNLEKSSIQHKSFINSRKTNEDYSSDLLKEAEIVYTSLKEFIVNQNIV